MAQKTNLNVSPYFDDYDPVDNFYKVLFKPGFPVQARELNNLQSIFQNQIENFGDHFFKDGSVVIPGGLSYDSEYFSVKINSEFLGIPVSTYANKFIGTVIRGQTTQVTARVVNVLSAEDSDDGELTLYVKYINSNDDGEDVTFTESELLLAEENVTYGNTTITQGSSFAQVVSDNATAIGSAISIADGVYFVRGYFVNVYSQTIILDQYTNEPSYRIGLSIIERTVNANEDETLFDNARGFNNYSAPGADRFQFELKLIKKDIDDIDDRSFVELLRLNQGFTEKAEQKTQYNIIKDYFAKRTYDESGDYSVVPFDLTLDECLNDEIGNGGIYEESQTTREDNIPSDDLFCLTVGPGKAYVNGYDIDVVGSRIIDVEKPRDTKPVENSLVPLDLGNILKVNNVFGSPVIGLNRDSTYVVELYNQRTTSNTAGTGEKIGEARIYSFGVSDASYSNDTTEWDLRLFDIQTYTQLTLNEEYQYSKGTYFKGLSSGATGYASEAWVSGDTVKLHQTSGSFMEGEQISIDGITEYPRSIKDIIFHTINDVKSVYQDASTLGLPSDFVADVVLKSRVASGFRATDKITITSGGTVTSPGNKFTGIATNSIIRYQNTTDAYNDEVYNRVTNVSADGNSMTVVAISDIAGVATGLLPSSSTTVDFRIGETDFSFGDNGGSLFIELDRDNISTIDLSSANLPVYNQLDGLSTDAFGSLTVSIGSVGISSALFENFDAERYSIHYSDGSIEDLTSDQFTINNNGTEIVFNGLKASETNVALIATVKKRGLKSKIKQYTRSTKVTVNKSKNRSAGVSTNLANGLDFNSFYGLRVEDEEISLNYPDVANVVAIYESNTSSAPVLDRLVFETGLGLDTNSILGELIKGPNNQSVAKIVTRSSPTSVEIVYLNDQRFAVGEEVVFQESGIIGTIQSVVNGNYIDRTDDFILDDGQRQDIYDYSRLVRNPGIKIPAKQLLVIFDHYTILSTDEGDAFTVLSYDGERYKSDIPTIFTPNSVSGFSIIRASDTIDFRPRVSPFTGTTSSPFDYDSRDFSTTGSTTNLIPKAGESTIVGYEYYLPRMDRVILTADGFFRVVKGQSSDDPKIPTIVEDSMTLATIQLPPYLYDIDDAKITLVDNKRYTMRDIGEIESRVSNLEEVTSLSILENDTKSLQVQDADGLSRFKSGFFADDFKNGDLFDQEYTTCVVDAGIKQLSVPTSRITLSPQIAPAVANLAKTFDYTTNYELLDNFLQKTGNVVSLRYNEAKYIEQAFATRIENVNPFNIIEYTGTIRLEPSTDTWVTNKSETKKVTKNKFKTLTNRSRQFRTVNVVGSPRSGRTTMSTKTSTDTKVTSSTTSAITDVSTDIDTKSTSDPFIRSRNVAFFADGLKPFTRYYSFFDGSKKLDVFPKYVEIESVVGSFKVGETVEGFIKNKNGKTERRVIFRLCVPNHKTGDFKNPDLTLDFNPYDKNQSLDNTTTYNTSSTFLNVDVNSLSLAAQGSFFGFIVQGMKLIGRTSGAEAVVKTNRLVSDGLGSLYGSFFFRNPETSQLRFKTGTKTFKLTNVSNDTLPLPGSKKHSEAEAAYSATGTTQRTTLTTTQVRTITTTRNVVNTITQTNTFRFQKLPPPKIIRRTTVIDRTRTIAPQITRVTNVTNVTNVRNVVEAPRRDPLAQSFLTDKKGAFITSVDIFMATKDDKAPLTVELRTIDLGLPTGQLVSLEAQVVLDPSQVNTSDDASVPTRVTFSAPIPVLPETEYALVLLAPTSDRYNAWIAKLGEKTVNTKELSGPDQLQYTKQYGAGSLFKSQNGSTWTPTQFEDLKFQINRCEFISKEGTATFYNPDIDHDSDILPTLPKNPIKSLPRQLDVGITTVTQTSMQELLNIGRKVGSGNTITGYIGNVGGPLSNIKVNIAGIGYSDGTYNDVSFFSITGSGSGAVGVVTVASNVVTEVSITTPGNGYVVGDTLGITTSDVTKGGRSQISVSNISGYDRLYLTGVRGEQFTVDESLVYYDDSETAVSLGNTFILNSTLTNNLYSGNVIEVLHPNHGMKDIRNSVEIYGVEPTRTPTTLSAAINATTATVSVADTTPFATFQGITTSAGFALIGNEVVYYNTIGSGTLGISTRGAEGTSASSHAVGDQIYPYEFNGISLAQINKTHEMPNGVIFQANKTIDTYYLEIDRGNRKTGQNQLSFESELVAGGDNVWASGNIQYDRVNARLDIVLPKTTSIDTRIRTVTGTSAGGIEPSFVDNGFAIAEPNATLLFGQPMMVASKVNEDSQLDNLPRNKSFAIEVDLNTEDGRYSPFIYLDNCAIDFDRSRIDSPITDYVTDSRVNSLNNDPHASIYVSDRIDMKNPATSLKLLTSAFVDTTSDIRALYRIFPVDSANTDQSFVLFPGYDNLRDTDGDGFGDQVIDGARNSGRPDKQVITTGGGGLREYQFSVDNLPPFTGYQIKIVFSGTNEAFTPRLNDLRTLALA